MNNTFAKLGSYPEEDVTFLLKNLSDLSIEKSTKEREREIQNGTHYSEMLPIEYKPSTEYMTLYSRSLEENKYKVALAVAVVSEQILENRGSHTVLCSLARAGTPIGVLIKRYIEYAYGISLPHYSISIIRGRGIDVNAINYICSNHPNWDITFIDGWTGKGAITKELTSAINAYNKENNTSLSTELAVLADPGYCSSLYGTRDDFLIPSSCLNSTVSGLVSRTVLNKQWIGENDFHGAKYYSNLKCEDVSNEFIETIASQFPLIKPAVKEALYNLKSSYEVPDWKGLSSIETIQEEFGISDINLIKPGVGETTRVLLRRVPWKILVHPDHKHHLTHILLLAEEKEVQVVEYNNMSYSCCGLIKPLEKEI